MVTQNPNHTDTLAVSPAPGLPDLLGLRPWRIMAAGWVCMMLLGGCKTLPTVDVDGVVPKQQTAHLASAEGPLSTRQSEAVLGALKRAALPTEVLGNALALMQATAGHPFVTGNRVSLLQNDGSAYAAMTAAIREARDHINMETYIFEDDKVGQRFARLLLRKQAEGVQVNLIYDSVGALDTPRIFFDRLKASGIQVLEFNPVNPLLVRKAWRLNHRDHRKLLIVDGKVAITGSVNIGDTYSSGPFMKSKTGTARPGQPSNWRDTQIRIEGPVVSEFQKIFIATWKGQKGPPLAHRRYFPRLSPRGREVVLAVNGKADARHNPIYVALIAAIESASVVLHCSWNLTERWRG